MRGFAASEIAKLGTNQSELGVTGQNTRPATAAEIPGDGARKLIDAAGQIRDAEIPDPTPWCARSTGAWMVMDSRRDGSWTLRPRRPG